MALTNSERQKRWREKHRALFNLRRRQSRNVKSIARVEERLKCLKELRSGIEEPQRESNRSRIEMTRNEKLGVDTESTESRPVESEQETTGKGEVELSRPPPLFTTKKVGEFRMVVLPEENPHTNAPSSTDTRSRSDIAMGIWRNDQGGVISKFAYDKLQKLKEHAKANNFEMDDYSQ